MLGFFVVMWLVMAFSLGLAMVSLHFIYRCLGSDMGLKGLRSEAVHVSVCATIQTGVPLAAYALAGAIPMYGWAVTALACYLYFKTTHLMQMDNMEIGLLPLCQIVVQTLLWYYVAFAVLSRYVW